MKLAAFIFVLSAPALVACINEYGEHVHPFKAANDALLALETLKPKKPWIELRRELEAKLAQARTKETLNDLAAVYIRFGEIKRAIPLLEEIERRYPSLYHTATNLGTAHELDGNLELALKWIQEGIRRNPKSHGGTEWLHARILQAKLELKKDPKWLDTHRVSGLARDPDARKSRVPEGQTIQTVFQALQLQLRERLPFTPQKDELVSQLLADYAFLAGAITGTYIGVGNIYVLAAQYSTAHNAELHEQANRSLQTVIPGPAPAPAK